MLLIEAMAIEIVLTVSFRMNSMVDLNHSYVTNYQRVGMPHLTGWEPKRAQVGLNNSCIAVAMPCRTAQSKGVCP